jgi:DNA-binding MarR family transcriptional regulator
MDHLPSWQLTQTAAHASRLLAEGFAQVGARGYHYRLLEMLIEGGPASQADLGRRTGIHLSDMVAALNELAADGYIERTPDPADKRRNVVTITPHGRERAHALAKQVDAIQDEIFAPLSTAERQELVRLLTLIRRGAAKE